MASTQGRACRAREGRRRRKGLAGEVWQETGCRAARLKDVTQTVPYVVAVGASSQAVTLSVKWGTHSVHGAVQRITRVAVSLEEVGKLISTPHKAPGRTLRGGHFHGLAPRFPLYCHERAGASSFLVSVTGGMVASFLNPAHTALPRALSPVSWLFRTFSNFSKISCQNSHSLEVLLISTSSFLKI